MSSVAAKSPHTAKLHALQHVARLAEWSATLQWATVPATVRDRLSLVLLDSLGVTMVGGRLPERAELVAHWAATPGPCPVFGTSSSTTVEAATWLNATAMVSLELDEGNKFAAGHPAAHCFPAILSLAADRDSDGASTAAALLVGYEVAARFGRASTGRPGLHPHGNWGMAGAAAGCARLLGLDADTTAAAIDAAAGMPIAGPFSAALDGNPVRNEWLGAANLAGLAAARLAAAGLAHATGIAADSLGNLLGTFDSAELVVDLDTRWDVELGYFKRHAACAFTHPAADAILALRNQVPHHRDIASIEVHTYSAATALTATQWHNRLSAMFSIPYVAATALVRGSVTPQDFSHPDTAADVKALATTVTVHADPDIDAGLPTARGARVAITLVDGRTLTHQVANPIGDAAHRPLTRTDTIDLLVDLLGEAHHVQSLASFVDHLPTRGGLRAALASLADHAPTDS